MSEFINNHCAHAAYYYLCKSIRAGGKGRKFNPVLRDIYYERYVAYFNISNDGGKIIL